MRRSEDQQVAVILDKRNNSLIRYLVEQGFVCAISIVPPWFVLLTPGACDGIDIEAQLIFVLAPAPASVDTPQASSWCIRQFGQNIFTPPDISLALLDDPIGAWQETIGGLQLKPLALAILVVDGYSLDSDSFHGFNAIELTHPVVLGQERTAVFATINQWLRASWFTQMPIAALTADQ